MSTTEFNYSKWPWGKYYILDEEVILPKGNNVKTLYVGIEGWSNKRILYIDIKNGFTYFQASAEGSGCHRCEICQERMKLIGYRTGHTFVEIKGNYSLFQKRNSLPRSFSKDDIGSYLGLPVISI